MSRKYNIFAYKNANDYIRGEKLFKTDAVQVGTAAETLSKISRDMFSKIFKLRKQ